MIQKRNCRDVCFSLFLFMCGAVNLQQMTVAEICSQIFLWLGGNLKKGRRRSQDYWLTFEFAFFLLLEGDF